MAIQCDKDGVDTPIYDVQGKLHKPDGTVVDKRIDAVAIWGVDRLVWKRNNKLHIEYNRNGISKAYFDFTVPPDKDNQRFIFATEYKVVATNCYFLRSSDGSRPEGNTGMGIDTTYTYINDSMKPDEILTQLRTLKASNESIVIVYAKDESAPVRKWTANLNSIKDVGNIIYDTAFRAEISMDLEGAEVPPCSIYTEIVWILFIWQWIVHVEMKGYPRWNQSRKGDESCYFSRTSDANSSSLTTLIKGAIALKGEYTTTQYITIDLTPGVGQKVSFAIHQDGFNSGSYSIRRFSSTPI